MEQNKARCSEWFASLRDLICNEFENIEREFLELGNIEGFQRKTWQRLGGGGGEMSIMHGSVFEKVGVNISTVYGEF